MLPGAVLDLPLAPAGLAALLASLLIVLTRRWHLRWTGDNLAGVQKLHLGAPPRVGLLPLLCGLLCALGLMPMSGADAQAQQETARLLGLLLLCSAPVVLLGLLEDLTKRVSARWRMAGALASAALALWLLDARIVRTDLPLLDALLALAPLSAAFTLLMVAGYTHAMNIIDGLNGLAAGLAGVMLLVTASIAWAWGDAPIAGVCALLAAALAGFWLLNYPRGMLFLGDGGAYLLGFVLVELWVLLALRHPTLSVWMAPAIGFLPTAETLFSMLRRKFVHRRPMMAPDHLHLHSLVFRAVLRCCAAHRQPQRRWVANALASALVTAAGAAPALAAMPYADQPLHSVAVFAAAAALFVLSYLLLVRRTLPNAGQNVGQNAGQNARARLNHPPGAERDGQTAGTLTQPPELPAAVDLR